MTSIEMTSVENRARHTTAPSWIRIAVVVAALTQGLAVGATEPTNEPAATADKELWTDSIVVYSVSRKVERIVEAPAAVTVLTSEEITNRSSQGQIPRLLAFSPGVEVSKSGLYDISLNARGFNSFANRRVLTQIDGRDPSLPIFSGSQEWAALSFQLDELDSIEFVRGPSAALYGAGAFNGVINLVTVGSRDSQGGRSRLALGELDSVRWSGRFAGQVSDDQFFKVRAGYETGDHFSRSRVDSTEYDDGILPRDLIELPDDRPRIGAFGFQLEDHRLGPGTAVLELGFESLSGTTFLTGAGRLQRDQVDRPWARFSYDTDHWHLQGAHTIRDSEEILLATGGRVFYDSTRTRFEAQGTYEIARGRGQIVGGVSLTRLRIDTANPAGAQTVLSEIGRSEHQALFGQIDFQFSDSLEGIASLRVDHSDLYDSRVSPRLGLVYQPAPRHTLRLSAGNAFQEPTLVELLFESVIAPPIDLSAIEETFAGQLGGVGLGLDQIPVLVVGNPDLQVQEIENLELGYTGVFGDHWLVSASVYRSELEQFVTPLLPYVGSDLTRLHNAVEPWSPPDGISPEVSEQILGALAASLPPSLFASLGTAEDGSPFVALLSLANFGKVETQGAELSITYNRDRWRAQLSGTFLDFEVREELTEGSLLPNAPDVSLAATLSYRGDRWSSSFSYRWVPEFHWLSGIFDGTVRRYSVADLMTQIDISDRLTLGLEVTNLFDDVHYELYGGDLLSRRAMAFAELRW